jgi:collagenase-like PrtC family protease
MNPEIELTVATKWDDVQIAEFAKLSTCERAVSSIFGSRQQQLIGHGRAPSDVPHVEDCAVVRHAKVAHDCGLQFIYLLNGRCEHLDLDDVKIRSQFLADLEWIVEEVRSDCVIVADLRVARLVRSKYAADSLAIRVSTIAGITRPRDLEPWLPLGLDGVVLHHDLGRDFDALANFVRFLKTTAPEVEIELLLNESCLHGCRTRNAHYARLAQAKLGYIEGFQQNCNIPKYLDPSLLLSSRWIRPEDIGHYSDLGIRRFKIAGREMSTPWLARVVRAYLAGMYQGNLIDLLTMTPPGLTVAASDFVFVDNAALEGFLDQLKEWEGDESDFYRYWSRDLWERGAIRIADPGASYVSDSSSLYCAIPGKFLGSLIDLQSKSDPVFLKRRTTSSVLVQLKSSRSGTPRS